MRKRPSKRLKLSRKKAGPVRLVRKKKKSSRSRRISIRSSDVVAKPLKMLVFTKSWFNHTGSGTPRLERYYKSIHTAETIDFKPAKGLDEAVHESLRQHTEQSAPAFAAMVKNGRAWGMNGYAITPDNRLLGDVSLEFSWNHIIARQHSLLSKWTPFPLQKTAMTVGLLTHVSSDNYFHWMYDVLPRIDLIRQSGWKADRYVVNGKNRQPFQHETLQMLGIAPDQIIYTHSKFHLQAQRMIIPSLVSRFTWSPGHYPQPVAYPNWACQFVRNELMIKPGIGGSSEFERIYVSRANARQRKLLNEEEIVNRLTPLGFKTIDSESMSVKDQIRAFASASCVVAPHGAGLSNVAFCAPGTKVIELFSPVYVPGYFWMLGNHFGLDYYYLIGDSHEFDAASWAGGAHFRVDPDRFERLLKRAGIE